MSNYQPAHGRYLAACNAYADVCARDPAHWHRPDVAEFTELRQLLLPLAEAGDPDCQYALASIHAMGLCCESEEEYAAGSASALEQATRWWIEAAKQGYWPALDNLAAAGVGSEADRVHLAWKQLESERCDLVRWSDRMPVYGPR